VVERAGIAAGRIDVGEDADARLVGVQAGEQRRARGAAARRVEELAEAHPLPAEPVEVRGADLPAETADVGVAEIVGQDEHDVRS
jgi:hypothetical protein